MRLIGVITWTTLLVSPVDGFTPQSRGSRASPQRSSAGQSTQLHMVFDFFKKRSEEGLEQLTKLSDAASKGKLGEGLTDLASYTKDTNNAFAVGLAKSRNRFLTNIESLMTGGSDDPLEDLQDVLLQADLGTATADDIVEEVRSLQQDSTKFLSRTDLMSVMRGKLIETLQTDNRAIQFSQDGSPTVLFVLGANGMGKTTTIGKLANRLRTEGNQTVLLAACDTFRAGAVEQLQQWADRAEVDQFGPNESMNSPSAVLYGALDKAIAEKYDVLIVDTSGRLSNNDALTAELAKMKRVIQKRLFKSRDEDGKQILNEQVPHESLLVLDAAQGRMALDSARVWNQEVGLTGLVLTKLDGSARGGSVVAVSRDLGLPVKLIGVGEGINDLRDFEPEFFVDGLLGIGAAGGKSSSSASKGEGAKLAARLSDLRAARAKRAPSMKKEAEESAKAAAQEAAMARTQMAERAAEISGQPERSNTNKNKKKKKKKAKR